MLVFFCYPFQTQHADSLAFNRDTNMAAIRPSQNPDDSGGRPLPLKPYGAGHNTIFIDDRDPLAHGFVVI
jgi:hypothetical protein